MISLVKNVVNASFSHELTEEHICNKRMKRNYNRKALVGIADIPEHSKCITFFEVYTNGNLSNLGSYLLAHCRNRKDTFYFILNVIEGEYFPPAPFYDCDNDGGGYTFENKNEVVSFAVEGKFDFIYLHNNNKGWTYCVPKNNKNVWRSLK